MRGDLAFAQREVARMLVRRGMEPIEPWIGVDFDGTLAEKPEQYRGPGWTGKPVLAMVDRVRGWLAEGRNVRVLTARVSSKNPPAEVDEARAAIEQWTEEQFGRRLDVVSEKDPGMVELWDDRAVRIRENTGQVAKAGGAAPGTRHVRADGQAWIKQQDGTWKPEKDRAEVPSGSPENVSKIPSGKPSPDGVKAHWTSQEGGLLFHGTKIPDGEEYVEGDDDGVVYLTNDFLEAAGYAQGIHLGGGGSGISKVLYLSVGAGEMADVSDEVDEAVANGDEFSGIFDHARRRGLKYVTFKHPSNVGSGEQTAVVALDPGDTLGPNRSGWNVQSNRPWRKHGQGAVGKGGSGDVR